METKEIEKKIGDIFSRGVGKFVDPDDAFRKKLLAKAKGEYPQDIIIKFGVDPTRPDIHLGHSVVLRKLRSLQDMGCKIIFLIGDYTAQIGDPTGKSKVRPEVEQKEVEANMKTYLDQVGKILRTDEKVFSWIRNSDWFYGVADIFSPNAVTVTQEGKSLTFPANSFLSKAAIFDQTRMQRTHLHKEGIESITFQGLLWTLKHITHGRLIQRDMFQERIENGEELYMHEMLYPVIQGIDSLIISHLYGSCDLEVGGTDQTFNMLMGRDVMKANKAVEQSVLSFELLVGTDGKEKMSKSLDNYVAITDEPSDMYGKIMSVPDTALKTYFELCTYTPLDMVKEIFEKIEKGGNPRDAKMRLAKEIVSIYHGEAKAIEAEEEFVNTFQKGGVPENMPEVNVSEKKYEALELLQKCFEGEDKSNSEIRRLFDQGAISLNEEKVSDIHEKLSVKDGDIVKAGKKTWFKLVK
ncbi:MAG: tyrosine--tRNA ligase [Candidatus Parcubacteria bacterium]|nr:tyrosine--tRNA ligase [Candidatus Parcubacteria bacterium]